MVDRLLRCLLAGLLLAAGSAMAQDGLRILGPTAPSTEREFVNVLARTAPGATAKVQGVAVPVYATGVFVRDRVPLELGRNLIRVEVSLPDGQVLQREIEVERVAPTPPPPPPRDRLVIESSSLAPLAEQRLAEGEAIELAMSGTTGAVAQARLPGGPWIRLTEEPAGSGRYAGRLVLRGSADSVPAAVQYRLEWPQRVKPPRGTPRRIDATSAGTVGLWHGDQPRWVSVGNEGAELTWGVHEVRLGGPNLAELPKGTLLRITGQRGNQYRVALAPGVDAWVASAQVEAAPSPLRPPRPVFSTLSVEGSEAGDVVTLPWPMPMPYAARVIAGADGKPAIEVELFGTHHATTWITHKASRRLVREATVEQSGPERIRVRIALNGPHLWGWRVEREARSLRVLIRPPPPHQPGAASPLAGLTVAVEAGHGGPTNLGAVGATGVPEKDINRWTSEALQRELEAAGARVVVIRPGDENPNLRERARRATESGAQLLISVHANSSETALGYLRARGTGMFYKHPASRDLAEAIQRRLLADTGLPDLGVVGNFNYAPIRLVTWMPAVLVEQAFVSNPEEEALMLDAAFRERLARAVRIGLEDLLKSREDHRP